MNPILDDRVVEPSGSLLGAGRRFFAAIWEHAGIRFELLALELAEERSRLIGALVAAASLVFCSALTLAFAGVALLVAAWDTPYRMLVVWLIAAAYAIAAIVAGITLRGLIGQQSPLFRHSMAEWNRDLDALRERGEAAEPR